MSEFQLKLNIAKAAPAPSLGAERRGEPVLAGSVVQTRPLFTTTELWNICYLAKVSGGGGGSGGGGFLLPLQTQWCLINTQICAGVDR